MDISLELFNATCAEVVDALNDGDWHLADTKCDEAQAINTALDVWLPDRSSRAQRCQSLESLRETIRFVYNLQIPRKGRDIAVHESLLRKRDLARDAVDDTVLRLAVECSKCHSSARAMVYVGKHRNTTFFSCHGCGSEEPLMDVAFGELIHFCHVGVPHRPLDHTTSRALRHAVLAKLDAAKPETAPE
ncbi:MAG TPA: hypothetical protein VM223_06455 [Planctomycetota bacterium]|nr:hypothetical protein [Planctomycetota bacterium]